MRARWTRVRATASPERVRSWNQAEVFQHVWIARDSDAPPRSRRRRSDAVRKKARSTIPGEP